MAITRLAVSTPSADTDVLMHTAARAAVESVIITNKNTTSASASVWIVPYGQDANSDNWVYIASNVVVDAGNTMETFRFPAVAADKIYIRSNKTNVSFSLNALYEVNGTSNITVQSTAPTSPRLGDVWVDSDDNNVYFWNDVSWISATHEIPDQAGNTGKYLTTDGSSLSWGTVDLSSYATTTYVDTAESDAITSANAYSDSLASNYDTAGSASAAQTAAEAYADGLSVNYDPVGSAATAESNANSYTDSAVSTHNLDTTNVHGIADTSALVVGEGITNIVALTQAEYDALTPDATTLYVITD